MNLRAFFQWRSMKARVTLFTLAIFLIGIWSLAFYSIRMLRDDLQALLGAQQISTVSIVAAKIDHELDDRLRGLEAVAATISPAMLGNPAALQEFVERLPILQRLFNGGVIVHRLDGTAIADVPLATGRIGVNYMAIDTVAAALKDGKSTIGRPVMGKTLLAPVFGMTAPIRDDQGRIIGALGGVTHLARPNFLDKLAAIPYGKTGGYVLLIPQDRLVVTATDKSRVMQPLPTPGINPALDRFLEGYEGAAVYTTPLGAEVLGSARGIPAAGWMLGLTLPTAEAFAPIHAMQERMFLVTIFLTLLAGGLTWWMLRRELSPILETAERLGAMADTGQPLRPLPVTGRNEISRLIGGFNRLLETVAQREATLRESETRYRSFFELSQDAIFVHRDNRIIFANDRAAGLFHANSAAALLGRDWHELIAPEDWPVTERRVAAIVSGEVSSQPPLERRHLTLDGQVATTESTGTRIIFDGEPAVLSVFRDISERKRIEEQRLADARQQRDTLVREVHHRIKNNLQSVAGLLQRELGRFVELDPRLATAISQVHAIAAVHGLQSADPDESISLCDNVCSICASVAELSRRPVRFHVEHEQSALRPARIEAGETVSLALVLNELILNAVKHSPPGSPAPTVSFSTGEASAQVLIRNAMTVSPNFNIDTGAGLGTGLRLVRSLLPSQGAHLAYELDTENFMLTRLNLTAPVVNTTLQKEPG